MENINFNKKINNFELKYLVLSFFIVFVIVEMFLILLGNDDKYSDENDSFTIDEKTNTNMIKK